MKKFGRCFGGYRRGATSFYIVAFSTLILVIIAASFATVMISEVTRTSNDDLSQSAYDSALAGIEDAKLAYANYQRCMAAHPTWINPSEFPGGDGTDDVTCNNIVQWMNEGGCDTVARILGRYNEGTKEQGVFITESKSSTGINMQQYYTCVKIGTVLTDYRANLTADNNVRIVKVQFGNNSNGVPMSAKDVATIRLSWYMMNDTETMNFSNYDTDSGARVSFYPATEKRPATPPTLALQLVQTTEKFVLGGSTSVWDAGMVNRSNGGLNGISQGDRTDRATLFFTPFGDECTGRFDCSSLREQAKSDASSGVAQGKNYEGVYDGSRTMIGGTRGGNYVSEAQVVKSNDQAISNVPFAVYCGDPDNAYACSVDVALPDPVTEGCGAQCNRSDDTFMFLVTLPYGEPDTDFSMQFFDRDGNLIELVNTQVTIDSTGRANDLYRRVETRLEPGDTAFPYTYYAMELLDGDSNAVMDKSMIVTCENNFYDDGTNVVYENERARGNFAGLSGSRHCDP